MSLRRAEAAVQFLKDIVSAIFIVFLLLIPVLFQELCGWMNWTGCAP